MNDIIKNPYSMLAIPLRYTTRLKRVPVRESRFSRELSLRDRTAEQERHLP